MLLNPLCAAAFAASQAGCKEPQTGTRDVPMLSPPLAEVVIGAGRSQFYSAPSSRCPMNGIFVIPKDEPTTYARTKDGWSAVMSPKPPNRQQRARLGQIIKIEKSGHRRSATTASLGMAQKPDTSELDPPVQRRLTISSLPGASDECRTRSHLESSKSSCSDGAVSRSDNVAHQSRGGSKGGQQSKDCGSVERGGCCMAHLQHGNCDRNSKHGFGRASVCPHRRRSPWTCRCCETDALRCEPISKPEVGLARISPFVASASG